MRMIRASPVPVTSQHVLGNYTMVTLGLNGANCAMNI